MTLYITVFIHLTVFAMENVVVESVGYFSYRKMIVINHKKILKVDISFYFIFISFLCCFIH